MESGFVEQKDCTLVSFLRFNQKDEVEGKEPLESMAPFVEGYRKCVVLIRNLEHKVLAVSVEVEFMALLGPPLNPVSCERE